MKVRIEFVPENTTEENVCQHLANTEEAMNEVSCKLQDTLNIYLQPAFELIVTRARRLHIPGYSSWHYYFEPWQPKVEVTYVRIAEKGET